MGANLNINDFFGETLCWGEVITSTWDFGANFVCLFWTPIIKHREEGFALEFDGTICCYLNRFVQHRIILHTSHNRDGENLFSLLSLGIHFVMLDKD